MKISPALLGCSLLANGVLAAVILTGTRSDSGAKSAAAAERRNSSPIVTEASVRPAAPSSATGASGEAWARLKTSDIRAYRAQLEAEGFPPLLARALAAGEVRRQFEPRRAALNLKANERPFWELAVQDPQTSMELAQINREQTQAIRDLLGPEPNDFEAGSLREQFPALTEDKIAQMLRVRQAIADKRADLYFSFGGTATNLADIDRIDALNREQRDEFAKFLTPQELEAYDVRNSTDADTLRGQLKAFDATEEEFLALFHLQTAYTDRFPPTRGALSPEESQARAAFQKELDQQARAALGDERFEQYQRSRDYNYQTTDRLVGRLDLPHSATDEVWTVQKDIQQRAAALQSDPTLTPAARIQQRAILADEAKTRVTATLGADGFEAYKQYGGSWLRSLQPPPPAPSPRAAP